MGDNAECSYWIVMDDGCLGDVLADFGHKNSGGEGSVPASTSYDSTATAFSQRSNQFAIQHDGTAAKKKRVSKIIGGGLRQFSIIVCKKVESKGRTTYSEVADEIIMEFTATNSNSAVSLDEFDEKNIRRRVYDALNVLMALDIIVKDKKEIRWKGLQSANVKDMEQIKELRVKQMNRIGKKAAYLKELEEQIAALQSLMLRNEQLLKSGNAPSGGFPLPFIVVRTSPHATVEIEISEDMQLIHFDFNSTPFSLHDDAYILKLLRCHQLPESKHISQSSSDLSSSSSDIASGANKPFYWNSEIDILK